MTDLLDYVEWPALQALNVKADKGIENALKQGLRDTPDLLTESDTDAQILINIPFTQAVRVTSIALRAPAGPTAPRTLRLFVDRPSLGFAEAEADPPAQEVVLTSADVAGGDDVPLRAARFARVTQLAILIADNQGGDEDEATVVSSIRVTGSAGDTFNVNEIKKGLVDYSSDSDDGAASPPPPPPPPIALPSAASLLADVGSGPSTSAPTSKRPAPAAGEGGRAKAARQGEGGAAATLVAATARRAGGGLLPPQLRGRPNVVTQDLERMGVPAERKKRQGGKKAGGVTPSRG